MAPNDPPPAPTASVAYASGLAAVTPVFVFGAGAAITQPAVTAFPTDALTLSFWINTIDAYAGVVVVSYDAMPAPNPHRLWIKTPGNLELGIGAQSTGPTGIGVADGAWHHVAVTLVPFGASRWSVAVYKDGIQSWTARAALAGSGSLETGGDLVLGQGVSGEPGLTGQMSEFRLLRGVQSPAAIATAMQIRMDPQDPSAVIVWALTSAQTAGQITGAGSFAPGAPPLVFHANRSLVASFTASTPGSTYDLQWSSSDGVWHPPLTGLPLAPVPLTTFEINTLYPAIVRAVLAGVPGPWSVPAEAVTLDLGRPIVSISQPAAAQVQLSWPSVDQALLYALLFYQNGATTPVPPSGTQPGTTFDLTPQVTGNDVWTYTIAATATGATSPLTPIVAVTAPDLQFVYDWALSTNGTLQASWTEADNAAFRYLTVLLDGGQTPIAAPLLPAATLAYVVQTAVTAGQTYTARVRALQSGAIGAWSPLATVVIHRLLAPLVTSIAADGAAHTITLAWTAPAGPAGQTFVAELWSGDGQTRLAAISPAVSPQVFQNAAIVDGASFKARVRTMADNSFGRWSDWSAITVNGLPKVQNVAARCDSSANVIVSWTPVTGFADVTYVASITGPNVNFQSAPVSANSITLAQADTHVQDHVTYAVTVKAQATGHAAGPWSDAANVTIGECGAFPPPPRPPVADPIDPATGAFLYSNDDLAVDAVMPLIFSTCYSSAVPTPSENPIYTGTPLGNRWTHSYNTRLARDANGQTLYVLWGNLSIDAFGIPSSITGVYANTGGSQGSTLVLGADLIFTLTLADQSTYRFTFDGALLSVTDRVGHQTTLTYAGGQLQTVTDVATGQRLTFTYTGQYLQRVADDSGRHVDFDYNGADLFHITDVIRGVRTFAYTGSSLIETIVDQRQNTAVKNVYTNGKVTNQQDARALKSGESYATTLAYRAETIDGMEMIITDVVDRAGHAITYQSRASNGALMSLRYDLGQGNIQVQQWTYDGFNNVLSETIYLGSAAGYTPGQGNTTTFTYDGDGNQLTSTVPLAGGAVSIVTRTYDAFNRPFTETVYEGPQAGYASAIGNVVHYGYNADGTLMSITDALGQAIGITYKPGAVSGLVDTFTDVLGNVFRCDYQGAYLQRVTNPFGEAVVYSRDGIGRVTGAQYLASDATIVAATRVTYYDTSLVETSRLSFAGQPDVDAFLTQYVYDANGNVHEVTGGQGTTTYEFDPNNFPSSVTYPAFRGSSRTIGMVYDRDDFVQTVTYSDASPVVKQDYVSDAVGRTLSYTDPNRRLYAYARTMLTNQGTPFPLQETLTWPTLASDPNTVFTDVTTSDPLGRVTAVTDRSQQTTNVAYTTVLDQPTQLLKWQTVVTWPPAQANHPRATIARQFDGAGRLTSVTDENGKTTTITYGKAQDSTTQTFVQVVTAIDPESNQEITTYDALGRLASLTRGRPDGPAPLTRTTAFAYDVLGRLRTVTETQGLSSVVTQYDYAYDPTSKRVRATIGRPGATTGSTVQVLQRRRTVAHASGSVRHDHRAHVRAVGRACDVQQRTPAATDLWLRSRRTPDDGDVPGSERVGAHARCERQPADEPDWRGAGVVARVR